VLSDVYPRTKFVVPNGLWLVAPPPEDPADVVAVVRATVRMTVARVGRPLQVVVPAFTDPELAGRFVLGLGRHLTGFGAYTAATPTELRDLLERLRDAGDTHLGLDPNSDRFFQVPIDHVLQAMC
jgi:hypothetical protein